MKWARRLSIGAAALTILGLAPLVWFDTASGKSVCFGTAAKGSIEGAVRMPATGANFRPYCWPCIAALRTYGHEKAIETAVAAYAELAKSHPGTTFLYGEIGLPKGGSFPPHRTHQNGLSFDFMVPVREGSLTAEPKAALLPATPLNRFGYSEDFDAKGTQKLDGGRIRFIDFNAIAAHLLALEEQARARGGRVRRVILAPDLQDDLFRAKGGSTVRKRLRFNRNQTWVRHDDHYHVDFDFPCR